MGRLEALRAKTKGGVGYSTTEYTENTERAKGGDPLGSNGAQEGGEKSHRVGVLKAQARHFEAGAALQSAASQPVAGLFLVSGGGVRAKCCNRGSRDPVCQIECVPSR